MTSRCLILMRNYLVEIALSILTLHRKSSFLLHAMILLILSLCVKPLLGFFRAINFTVSLFKDARANSKFARRREDETDRTNDFSRKNRSVSPQIIGNRHDMNARKL